MPQNPRHRNALILIIDNRDQPGSTVRNVEHDVRSCGVGSVKRKSHVRDVSPPRALRDRRPASKRCPPFRVGFTGVDDFLPPDNLHCRIFALLRSPVNRLAGDGGSGASRKEQPLIVVDASAIIEVLLQTAAGRRVGQRIFGVNETLHAPHLIDLEVTQALRRFVRSGALAANRAGEALADLMDIPMTRYAHSVLLPRVWQMRDNASAYGAAYLALAEVLDAPLVTRDGVLAKAGSRARVEVI